MRIDLALFQIQSFHLENALFESPSNGKAVLKELSRIRETATTKHQVAVIRYDAA
jgi:hypothetical protein